MKIWISLKALRNNYVYGCKYRNEEFKIMGIPSEEEPTLTGWIKFWRSYENNPKYKIGYRNEERNKV